MKRVTWAIVAGIAFWSGTALYAADNDKTGNLYQRLGGMPAIQAVVDDLVTRILADERVNRYFAHAGADPENARAYKAKLADFICQATGGPCKYAGADMVTAHAGRGITEDAFNAVVSDLVATLDKLQVPEKEKNQLLGLLGPMKAAIVQSKQ
ncbi:MAG TPA: group 1 truncated hemoglobin [Bryobacteraceae bacterium]|nr:group 1 truncated hemoglobin [Bryobacteraceae bacterium]